MVIPLEFPEFLGNFGIPRKSSEIPKKEPWRVPNIPVNSEKKVPSSAAAADAITFVSLPRNSVRHLKSQFRPTMVKTLDFGDR